MRLVREAISKQQPADGGLTRAGRHFEARSHPVAGRRALVYIRDVTEGRDTEVRRLQSAKLAAIGMLAAGMAHEINNPASFVLANTEALGGMLSILDEKLRADPALARRLGVKDLLFEAMAIVQESKEGMARIQRIVRDLHSFSRVDDDPAGFTDVNAAVDSALTMLRNELRYRAQVERRLHRHPPGAGQLGPAGPGLPEPHRQRRPGPARGPAQAQPDRRAQLRPGRRGGHRGGGQRSRHPARGHAPHLRLLLHHQAGRGRHRSGSVDLPRDRALGGRRDHAENARSEGALFRVRLPAAAASRPVASAAPARCPADGGTACWPSTTRCCCSRPTGAC